MAIYQCVSCVDLRTQRDAAQAKLDDAMNVLTQWEHLEKATAIAQRDALATALAYAARETSWAAQRFDAKKMNVDANTMRDVAAKAEAALAAMGATP